MNNSRIATHPVAGKDADDPGLLAWNLFVMTAAMCLGLMMAGK